MNSRMQSISSSSTLISSMPMLMPGAERNGVNRKRLAAQARERGAGVGERVHPDAEPRDPVAAGDADRD